MQKGILYFWKKKKKKTPVDFNCKAELSEVIDSLLIQFYLPQEPI